MSKKQRVRFTPQPKGCGFSPTRLIKESERERIVKLIEEWKEYQINRYGEGDEFVEEINQLIAKIRER